MFNDKIKNDLPLMLGIRQKIFTLPTIQLFIKGTRHFNKGKKYIK